jgi:hypothetical protein
VLSGRAFLNHEDWRLSRGLVSPIEEAQDCRPGIFSAVPGGTVPGAHAYPGLASWATLSRPFGTDPDTP